MQVRAINSRGCAMKPIERITLLCALGALAYACSPDNSPAGPGAAMRLTADASDADQPMYGPWGAPTNLVPVLNSSYNDNHPAISKNDPSTYTTSGPPGGVNGANLLPFADIGGLQR